ncbi:TPA: hypothetical protein DCR49_11515 [Candidatus Delongbacteria bacterium]|nr:MAG: hypothetical protein A2Y39_01420 [Candidatus Delongbacteria bacterium GWF2_40_14]HAQ62601.1 hypothetical protein [Candidatus Delongbacteria bacterium]
MSGSYLIRGISSCSMPCCQIVDAKSEASVQNSHCCKTGEVKQCACKIEFPAETAAQTNPSTPQKTTEPRNVYICFLPKCVLCIEPVSGYKFDNRPDLFFITSESNIFSGRSPPSA